MSHLKDDDEPLFPPWVAGIAVKAAPIVILALLYWLLKNVLKVPGNIAMPILLVLGLAVLIYFGGRFYKPYRVSKENRCTAVGAEQRRGCRHFFPGARLGGGCGRLREDGRCRHAAGR